MVLVSIAGWPEQNVKMGAVIWKQTRPKGWSNGLTGNDVRRANLWSCASVVVSKKVWDNDTKCGEEQWESQLWLFCLPPAFVPQTATVGVHIALARTFDLKACLKNIFQTGPEGPMERANVFVPSTLVHMFTVTVSVCNFWFCENCSLMPKIWVEFCKVWNFRKLFFVIQILHVSPAFGQCSWTLDKCAHDIATMHALCSSNMGWHWMNTCW